MRLHHVTLSLNLLAQNRRHIDFPVSSKDNHSVSLKV